MKIFVGWFGHECNTLSCKVMEFADLTRGKALSRGQEVLDRMKGKSGYLSGMIQCAHENGDVELVSSIHTEIASPIFSMDCLEKYMAEVMRDLEACKSEIDGICFVLHGAGVAVGVDDMESYVLREFRKVVGPDMPITVPLDLHGNVSQEMVELSDGLFCIKQYPHIDYFECGYLAMKTLVDMIRTGERPENACVNIPLLIPAVAGNTLCEPVLSMVKYVSDYVKEKGLIDATFMHGFPYADVPFTGASIIVVAKEGAQEAAEHLANYIWERREKFVPPMITPVEAFEQAIAFEGEGYVLMSEPSDNPGGGAPGDGTWLLREMVEQNLPNTIFTHIYDPEVAQQLIACGVGGRTDITLGGKIEPAEMHGAPLELKDVEVLAIATDSRMISNSPVTMGLTREIGPCARIKVDNVEIIVGSLSTQTMDDRIFPVLGTLAENYRIIGIKSTNHYRAFYKDHAALIIPVETRGIHCGDLRTYTYEKVRRPIFPLDRDFNWRAGE